MADRHKAHLPFIDKLAHQPDRFLLDDRVEPEGWLFSDDHGGVEKEDAGKRKALRWTGIPRPAVVLVRVEPRASHDVP